MDAQERDHEELLEYVERFALVLHSSGIPRMPSRVFAYALGKGSSAYTAAELAAGLRVSHAAISGAVRYLVSVGMMHKGRRPGSRADHYHVHEDALWESIIAQQDEALRGCEAVAQDGIDTLGTETVGGQRMRETREFFKFMRDDLDNLLDRWRTHWANVKDRPDASHPSDAG